MSNNLFSLSLSLSSWRPNHFNPVTITIVQEDGSKHTMRASQITRNLRAAVTTRCPLKMAIGLMRHVSGRDCKEKIRERGNKGEKEGSKPASPEMRLCMSLACVCLMTRKDKDQMTFAP